jgi:hypothetical protein
MLSAICRHSCSRTGHCGSRRNRQQHNGHSAITGSRPVLRSPMRCS